eukprot:SAG31_NODE_14346_length_812_cov_1.008415_2_plen_64_part_01
MPTTISVLVGINVWRAALLNLHRTTKFGTTAVFYKNKLNLVPGRGYRYVPAGGYIVIIPAGAMR